MSTKAVSTNSVFFAAANGYTGFRSYFSEIFDSSEYTRIFVLKGGPGTGKSSLMRRVEQELAERGYATEAILCSSDPDSLDGVIAERDGGRVAILDGTSPHERDAVIPGAIDVLVPLGELWDGRFIEAQSEKILELTRGKSMAYKTAYSYLKIAGTADTTVKSCTQAQSVGMNKAVDLILAELTDVGHGKISTRLISAFGKRGYITIPTLEHISEKKILIGGSPAHAGALMSEVLGRVRSLGYKCTRLPSPLSDGETEALYFGNTKTAIVLGDGDDCAINADELFPKDEADRERSRVAEQLRGFALEEAVRWFGIASDIHFRLEEIYTSAMCFEGMEEIYAEIMRKL